MDGGIDDVLALVLAFRSPELDVAGVTAVSGNVPVGQATINGLRVVELLERRNVWVARGLANPLVREPIRATRFHGKDGLGDSHLLMPKIRESKQTAYEKFSEELATTKRKGLSVICTGPLTNIASLITGSPDLAKRLGELVIMGGAFGFTEYGIGNETPVAEFNVYSDPEAAKIVFESGLGVRTVGLDVTMMPTSQLTVKDYMSLTRLKTKTGRFASRILAKTIRRHGKFALHDPMAVAAAIKPSIFHFFAYGVFVETKGEFTTGMTILDRRDSGEVRDRQEILVCDRVAAEDFKRLFLSRLVKS